MKILNISYVLPIKGNESKNDIIFRLQNYMTTYDNIGMAKINVKDNIEVQTATELNEIIKYLKPFNYSIKGKCCSTPTYHLVSK